MSYQKPVFRLYVDEVGTSGYGENLNVVDRRYLSLTGAAANLEEVKSLITPTLDEFKTKFFGDTHHPDNPVILHRDDIVKKKGIFRILEDEATAKEWESRFLEFLKTSPITCITVVHDKKSHLERYGNAAFHPYHYSLTVLLERYIKFLQDNDSCGDVMAESRGKKEDKKLALEYQKVYESGTYYIPAVEFQKYLTSKEIKIKPKSKNISCLQTADLIAHPIRYEILREHGCCEDLSSDFSKKICQLLDKEGKHFKGVDRGGFARVSGFGKVFLG